MTKEEEEEEGEEAVAKAEASVRGDCEWGEEVEANRVNGRDAVAPTFCFSNAVSKRTALVAMVTIEK